MCHQPESIVGKYVHHSFEFADHRDMARIGFTLTEQYLLSTRSVDTENCPSSRCYHLSAVPIGTQVEDGVLHLRYDASQAEPSQRLRKERIAQGSSKPWD